MVAGIALPGTGTQGTGRGHYRRAGLSLVGPYHQRTGYLHGRRDKKDCRGVKYGLNIHLTKRQVTEIGGFAFSRRFCKPLISAFLLTDIAINAESNDLKS